MGTVDFEGYPIPVTSSGIRYIADYEICDSDAQLVTILDTINRCQYQLVSVTQNSKDVYRVFFRRCVVG